MASAHDELEKKPQDSNAAPIRFSLEYLKDITSDFSTKSVLGEGGYGVVYKGILQCGKIIAVKKLRELHQNDETFQNEITYLMGTKHENVVQFVGYCAESTWELREYPSGSGKHILAEMPNRLLCFEYVSNRSLDKHISDESLGLEWNTRYGIIKGICSGLHFLHEERYIVHLDLKPQNILLDDTMIPKIADFGLSRLFGEKKSRTDTVNRAGTLASVLCGSGYMAPEYINQGLISKKADIFSLGVIIMEIITGRRDYPDVKQESPQSTSISFQHFRKEVLESWRNKFVSSSVYIPMEQYNQQIKQCINIAQKCLNPGMERRPTTKDIIQVLDAADQVEACEELLSAMQCTDQLLVLNTTMSKDLILERFTKDLFNYETDSEVLDEAKSEGYSPMPLSLSSTANQNYQDAAKESSEPQPASDTAPEVILPGSVELFNDSPHMLHFPFEPNELIPSSLHLRNNTDAHVPFMLMKKSNNKGMCFVRLPLYGIVPPRSTYTLVVIIDKKENLPEEREDELILRSIINGKCSCTAVRLACEGLFEEAEKSGNTVVHTVKAVYARQEETTYEAILPPVKIMRMDDNYHTSNIFCLDAHPSEPWIITSHWSGQVIIWSCNTQEVMVSRNVGIGQVCSIKFIARKQLFVVGFTTGSIHVYKYQIGQLKKIRHIKQISVDNGLQSLAVHPTQSYVLLVFHRFISLWDGERGWKLVRTFTGHSGFVRQVTFNPMDTNSFASASEDNTIKVWNMGSPEHKYTLSGHSGGVNCLDFFMRAGQQHLVTGSNDINAKIWDLKERMCVYTLKAFMSPVVSVVNLPWLKQK
ncbi:uncharacterized protein LOC125529131 isoform X6 [Triticum urartu]|uniref:uncharacterized protein LOC125529131 isoform X6 n=2 Tax=Triticum urartu TaxID=4572 RepID=UPI002044C30B|nr:uncharacterized protein LOC125529131 isoform X6 [Triticum urartu]